MTKPKTSTTTPKEFKIKGKQEVNDGDAVVSNEFKIDGHDWQGQTLEVPGVDLRKDQGTGESIILRTFQFSANPEAFKKSFSAQDIFNTHSKGIEAFLWQDGLKPVVEIEPRLILSRDNSRYLIIVGARPQTGQAVLEKTKTLMEIANEARTNSNQVSRSV